MQISHRHYSLKERKRRQATGGEQSDRGEIVAKNETALSFAHLTSSQSCLAISLPQYTLAPAKL